MSNSSLPPRASLEYLKKLAKDRLRELRQTAPDAKLAAAQLAVAREHGFPSWRALKAEVERRQPTTTARFFAACADDDVDALRALLAAEPALARTTNPNARHGGWTGLHTAAQRGHLDAVRTLLAAGADPNAREAGDNTYPLHWAAAAGHEAIVRALLDSGGDAHGMGDLHELDTIGWATYFHKPGEPGADNAAVVALLLEHGARHHIISAICVGDLDLIRTVAKTPGALARRMSRFEGRQTALHLAIQRQRYDVLDLLIAEGADLEGEDGSGQTALQLAMMRGDREAMRRLHAAGAKAHKGWTVEAAKDRAPADAASLRAAVAKKAASIKKLIPMLQVPDVARTLDWYVSIGFTEAARYEDEGSVGFGMVTFGKAELMLVPGGKEGGHDVSLWFYTDRVDDLYHLLKDRQIAAAQAILDGKPGDHPGVQFVEDLNEPFYSGREFGIRDLNGYAVYFLQPES
ncbi:MAG TPA: ankyrin repeat domain-containing protein [Thermoanaerobaculia bacterium]